MRASSLAVRLTLPARTTLPAPMRAAIPLWIWFLPYDAATAIPTPTWPAPTPSWPDADSAWMVDVERASRVRAWAPVSTWAASMAAVTVLRTSLSDRPTPIAPATPVVPAPTAPEMPPLVALTLAPSVAFSKVVAARTPALPAVPGALEMVAATVFSIRLREAAPSPATATPVVPAPTETAPPMDMARMVAVSFANSDSAPPAATVDWSMRARTLLRISLIDRATPTETLTPVVPAPTASPTPPASAVIVLASCASRLMAPPTCTLLPLRIAASTSVVMKLPEPAPARPMPTPVCPPPAPMEPPMVKASINAASVAAMPRSAPPVSTRLASIDASITPVTRFTEADSPMPMPTPVPLPPPTAMPTPPASTTMVLVSWACRLVLPWVLTVLLLRTRAWALLWIWLSVTDPPMAAAMPEPEPDAPTLPAPPMARA